MTFMICETCIWYDPLNGVCCNGYSKYGADFTEPNFACYAWENELEDEWEFAEEAAT